jgi:hypothetical protein
MDVAKTLAVLSALSGFAGACVLFFWTFGFEMPGTFLRTHDDVAQGSARNARRQVMQKVGLGLLVLSFLLNLISILSSN